MSARRFIAASVVVIVAVLCVPAALPAGFSSADAITVAAPIVLLAIIARPRRPKTPAGGAPSPTPTDAALVGAPPAGPHL